MILKNKLNLTDAVELARVEEKLSKSKANTLFKSGFLDTLKAGSFQALVDIHTYLFAEIYDFMKEAGTISISFTNHWLTHGLFLIRQVI